MGDFEPGIGIKYNENTGQCGLYIHYEGAVKLDDQVLNKRHTLGVYNTSSFTIKTEAKFRLLLIEIPMLQ